VTRLGRALLALFLANLAAVVAVWWVALDEHTFASLAGALNAVGRITGLVGTYLILVQLVLRTHVPWLLAAFTKDDLKKWHTWNGNIAFGLIGAHGLFQFVGYAMADEVDLARELVLLLTLYDGMLLAFASLGLLVVLTVLALDRYRHRIPWPTWRALHLYTYVAVALSVPHQIATGSDFIDAPLAVAYWTGLLAVVFAVIVVARVPPLWRAATATSRPSSAVVVIGAVVLAAYLAGAVKLSSPEAVLAAPAATLTPRIPFPTPGPSGPAPTATPAAATLPVAIEGEAFDTPYGRAQVRLIITSGHISDIEPMVLPAATSRSKTISNAAEYWLRKRAIAAQSAHFEVLSGASYTSRAYQASLESALRIAGLD
jgi:hypothetical protein